MHELALTRSIVGIVADNAGKRRVRRVAVEVGDLSGVMADAIAFCFDICAKDTVVEGATLDLRRIAGRGFCEACGTEMQISSLFQPCTCGSRRLKCIAGEELNVKEMELFEAEPA
jgi:hydrogenase nickel incorporation protein HypA/HybF